MATSVGETWGRDEKNLKDNITKILKPFKQGKNEWILLCADINFIDENNKWADSYFISCNISEQDHLDELYNADELTIHKPYYNKNIYLYSDYELDNKCMQVNSFGTGENGVDQTKLVLPPAKIIRDLNLHFDSENCSWNNSQNQMIIICNNNKYSYKGQTFSNTVFMRYDYYNKLKLDQNMKFFIYTERRLDPYGFFHETSYHLEIKKNKIIKEIHNY